jgi:two-component system, NtrC family, response regulator
MTEPPPAGRPAVLVVDDDPAVVESLAVLLDEGGYGVRTAATPAAARAAVAGEPRLAAAIQDLNFTRDTSGREGLALLAELRALRPELPVVLLTAWGTIDLAVEGMKAGAADFLTKPWDNRRLLETLATALALAPGAAAAAPTGPAPSRADLERRLDLGGVVGEDPAFLRVLELVARVAPTDAPVLLLGESGTGKEVIAELVHRNSRRRDGPFVAVNLGGVSSTLFESEMFGHVRGAFTDARADREGRFAAAEGGTLFLDEVGEVDASSQVKLLRVLQDRRYEVLGSSRTRTADVRVVSATNADLPALVARGRFREDLLYRLNLIAVRLPALRERPGDVPRLARSFLDRACRVHGRAKRLAPDAVRWLGAQPWPGNVRELEQTVQRAVLILDRDEIRARDLEALLRLPAAATAAAAGDDALPAAGAMTLGEIERAMIEKALARFDGHVTRAAEALGLTRQTLYRRMEKHGISPL